MSLQIHEDEDRASVLASQFVLSEHNYSKSAMDVDISREPESEGEVISVCIIISKCMQVCTGLLSCTRQSVPMPIREHVNVV